jgi:hypothetical protein
MTPDERIDILEKKAKELGFNIYDLLPGFLPRSFYEGTVTEEDVKSKLADLMEKILDAKQKDLEGGKNATS